MLVEGSKGAAPFPVQLLRYKGADCCTVHVVGGAVSYRMHARAIGQ